jgi:hypothetical protein
MASRTQILCLCEGEHGKSIDSVFINRLLKLLKPDWVRQWGGSNTVRINPCGSRRDVVVRMPDELRNCAKMGGNATLMVWADCDDDCANGDVLKELFWQEAKRKQVARDDFDSVVFIFPKDRLENWIEFLNTGETDESQEGRRVRHNREAAEAAKELAKKCKAGSPMPKIPVSLKWSCDNWHAFAQRLKSS